jgi:protein TonB
MRPATAYCVSALVHLLAFGVLGSWAGNSYVQYRVASGESVLVQFAQAPAQAAARPIELEVNTEIESAPELPEASFTPSEHALAPQTVAVDRRAMAEIATEPARAEPEQAPASPTQETARASAQQQPTESAARPPIERQVQRTEVASVSTSVPLQAVAVQNAGAKVEQMPSKLPANPEPPYPTDAWLAGREGRVTVRVQIAPTGLVERADIEISSGWTSFDESALTTIRRWRFEPAKSGGAAVWAEVLIPIRFQLRRG